MILQIIRRMFRPSSPPRRLGVLLLIALALNFVFGTAFYFAERSLQPGLTYTDSIWWAMVTMTTVGYGDFFAQSWAGRFLISYPTFIIGIGLLGYVLGIVADLLIETTSARRMGRTKLRMKDHILICGMPNASKVLQISREIRAVPALANVDLVVICDGVDRLPEELEKAGLHFVRGSALSEEVLRKASIETCQGAFVLSEDPNNPDSDARTFAIGTIIESMERDVGHSIRTVCELVGASNTKMMRRTGTDGTVVHEGMTDCLLVQEYFNPGVMAIFQQLISSAVGCQFYLVKTELAGHKVYDLQLAALEHPHNFQIVGLIQGDQTILNPSKDIMLQEGDRLVILANRLQHFKDVETELLQQAR